MAKWNPRRLFTSKRLKWAGLISSVLLIAMYGIYLAYTIATI